jgi:hypothetical protein
MKWIPQVKHKGIYHTVTGGELELRVVLLAITKRYLPSGV